MKKLFTVVLILVLALSVPGLALASNEAEVTQTGGGNTVTINQYGDNQATVDQNGENNDAVVGQHGSNETTVTQELALIAANVSQEDRE